MNIGTFVKVQLAQVLVGVLAASLIANVFLFLHGQNQVVKKVECTQALKVAAKIEKEKTDRVIVRQEKVNVSTQDSVSKRISYATSSLRREVRSSNEASPSAVPSSGTPTEGGTPVVLSDRNICITNTILAEEWPKWYSEQVNIRKEEYGTNPEGSSVPHP